MMDVYKLIRRQRHNPEVLKGMNLVAIDTMHLFPTTLTCADKGTKLGGEVDKWGVEHFCEHDMYTVSR